MTKELLPGLLAVEGIPKNASHFGIAFDNEALNFLVPSEYVDGGVTAKSIHFNATGNLKVLGSGTADKITEEEWAGVVRPLFTKEDIYQDGRYHHELNLSPMPYLNYLWETDKDDGSQFSSWDTATASGLSLLKLHNLNPSITVLLKTKK